MMSKKSEQNAHLDFLGLCKIYLLIPYGYPPTEKVRPEFRIFEGYFVLETCSALPKEYSLRENI